MPSKGWCWLREASRLLAQGAEGPATPEHEGQEIGLVPPSLTHHQLQLWPLGS